MTEENENINLEEVDHSPVDPVDEPVVVEQPEPEDEEKKELKSKYRRETRNRKKLERELAEIKSQVSELRTGHVGSAIDGRLQQIGQEYSTAEQAYHQALATGDPTKITMANRNLMQRYTAWVLANEKATQVKEQQKYQQQQPAQQPDQRTLNRWKAKNDWFSDPEHEEETEMAAKIDSRLASEWDDEIGSPEYFEELDRRLSKKLPHLYKGRSTGSQNVAGSSRASSSSPGRVTLPKELIEAARTLGRPVDDPEWRKRMAEKYVRRK